MKSMNVLVRLKKPFYGFAALLIVISASLSAQSFIYLDGVYWGIADSLQRFVAPGEATLSLSQTGTYIIYHEFNSTLYGQTFANAPGLQGLSARLAGTPDQPVPLTKIRWQDQYAFKERKGEAMWRFEIDEPGQYALRVDTPDAVAGFAAVIAVGQDVRAQSLQTVMRFFWTFLGTFAIGIAGVSLGISTRMAQRKHAIHQTRNEEHRELD